MQADDLHDLAVPCCLAISSLGLTCVDQLAGKACYIPRRRYYSTSFQTRMVQGGLKDGSMSFSCRSIRWLRDIFDIERQVRLDSTIHTSRARDEDVRQSGDEALSVSTK
jgi:hypothetical protein